MRRVLATFVFILSILGSAPQADELPQLRVAVLEIGTVNWELDTIKRLELDKQNGFELVVPGCADAGQTRRFNQCKLNPETK